MEDNGTALVEKAVEIALAGDIAALRLVLDRVLPPIRAKDEAVTLNFSGSLAGQGETAIRAMAEGRISPSEASTVMATLTAHARLVEATDLLQRIEILEKKHARF